MAHGRGFFPGMAAMWFLLWPGCQKFDSSLLLDRAFVKLIFFTISRHTSALILRLRLLEFSNFFVVGRSAAVVSDLALLTFAEESIVVVHSLS